MHAHPRAIRGTDVEVARALLVLLGFLAGWPGLGPGAWADCGQSVGARASAIANTAICAGARVCVCVCAVRPPRRILKVTHAHTH